MIGGRSAGYRRGLAAGVGLVLVLAACSPGAESDTTEVPFTLPTTTTSTSTTTQSTPATTSTTVVETPLYLWQAGDCVDRGANAAVELPYAPYGTELIVDCSQPHTHEVFFTSTLEGGPAAPYPENLNNELFAICYEEFLRSAGFRATDATLDIVLYLPDPNEWDAGERYHACVVYQAASPFHYQHFTSGVVEDLAAYRWNIEEGDCIDDELWALKPAGPVPCSEQHTFELIGEVVHPAGGDAPYPGEVAITEFAGIACSDALIEYANQAFDAELVRTLSIPFPLPRGEWELGQRSIRCFAFAATVSEGLFNVVGSLADGTFEIVEPREDGGGITA